MRLTKPKIGLLPLYLELYDSAIPEIRPRIDAFVETIIAALGMRRLDVLATPARRVKEEFEGAIRFFEDAHVDAIVTLHLAYSPSLESIDALAGTKLPIIVLDTTPGCSFGPDEDPAEIMYNHGIHGVQDMCNMLVRRGKPFWIEAGHWETSDVLDRVASWARAARISSNIRKAKVGRIGDPFHAMGDFEVAPEVLRHRIGVRTVACDLAMLRSLVPEAGEEEVASEMASDAEKFDASRVGREAHLRTVRSGLALRRWIEKEKLTAFTMNFLAIDGSSGIPTVPFLEASKAMARGIGYAGEGDVLTAALVGALASACPGVTFTEMFCPDWKGGSVFVSHMGEMNPRISSRKPVLVEKPFPWTDAQDPVVAVGTFRGGRAALVDLAPGPDESFSLIVAPVNVLDVPDADGTGDSVRGWFKPDMPLEDFLANYSRAGGTHHAALVYGEMARELARFGHIMGWRVVVLD